MYRDIDSKGSGYVEWNPWKKEAGGSERGLVGVGFDGSRWGDGAGLRGLLDIDSARRDQAFGEIFSEGGVRVVLPLAIIKLKEIINEDGKRISIEEARAGGILKEDFDPVIELRAFGTRHRVSNWGFWGPGMSREGLNDAMALVAKEIGLAPEEFTPRDYLLWFAKTFGEEMRKIHEMGFAHGGLHDQNLTLDCRLADFDTVKSILSNQRKRARVVSAEGLRSYFLVISLREKIAEYHRELKRNNDESDEGGDPVMDELDNAIKRAYEEGYGEVTDDFVQGESHLDEIIN